MTYLAVTTPWMGPTMSDLEEELRGALGDPPADSFAKERALIRLRAEYSELAATFSPDERRSRRVLQPLAIALAIGLVGLAVFGVSNIRQSAVATELDGLAQANVRWAADSQPPPVRLEQWGVQPHIVVGGPTFNLIVRSLISIRPNDDGSILRTERILDRAFATPEDRRVWESLEEPDIPEVGEGESERIPPAFDLAELSKDPEELRKTLESGEITGYVPNGGQLFETIGSLLVEPSIDLEQRRALYEVVSSLDGVELLGAVTDPLERPGIGFAYEVGSRKQVLIFDRDTGQPLAFEEYSSVDPAQIDQWVAFNPPNSGY